MPGKSDSLLVGLSMGTTKISMIVAEKDNRYPDSVHIIGFGNAPSNGISKGIIVSHQDARQSVEEAFAEAQSITGIQAKRLSNVIVAFNADGIESKTSHGMVTLGDRDSRSVKPNDIDRAIDRARRDLALRSSMYPLHMIPTSYELDGRPVDEPLNMNGNQLDLWLQTVSVPMTHIQNVINCVRAAGLEIRGLLLKPLAASLGALYEEEMRSGCISINIGGGTTGIVLYRGGRAFRVISIPIGGDHIKNDLATLMRISLADAEHLKKRIFTTPEEKLIQEGIDVDFAYEIITARIEELFGKQVRSALAECTPQSFPNGIILSGGVSEMPGINDVLQNIMQMPVRKVVEPIYKMPRGLDTPAYVSSAGILKYFVSTERDPYLFMESDQPLPGLSNRSEMRERQEQRSQERRERERNAEINNDLDDEDYFDDEPEDKPEPERQRGGFWSKRKANNNNNNNDDDEGEYEDDTPQNDDNPRRTFGQIAKKIAELFKEAF